MVDLQTIGVLTTGVSVTVPAVYYVLNIRAQARTREARLFVQIYHRWTEKEFQDDYIQIVFQRYKDYEVSKTNKLTNKHSYV